MLRNINIDKRWYAVEEMPKGSFVDIYRAVNEADTSDIRLVKVINSRFADNDTVQQRFLEEIRILQSLAGQGCYFTQNLLTGKIDQRPFLSYQYVHGQTVLHRLKTWSPDEYTPLFCCAIMEQVLSALRILHERPNAIIHSDLSPENLILHDEQVVLIDMGCAQELTDDSPSAKRWVGKPSYLSPEQARGDLWSAQSDIFQAGIVFYELLTGQRWNRGTNAQGKKVFASDPPLTKYNTLPIEVRPLLRSMLKTDAAERIATATLCLTRLEFARNALLKRYC